MKEQRSMVDANWFRDLKEKYNTGVSNNFVIHGNIGDYTVPGIYLKNYLCLKLEEMGFTEIISYNKASSIEVVKGDTLIANEDAFMCLCNLISLTDNINTKRAVIIEYPEFLVPNTPITQMNDYVQNRVIMLHRAVNGEAFINSDNIVIFICETKGEINQRFVNSNSRSHTISIDFPNEEERLEMLKYLEDTTKEKVEKEVSLEKLSKLTAGLTRVSIEDIYLQAEQVGILKKEFIIQRKNELIRREYGEVIEIFDTDGYSFEDYAGQEHLKNYHREVIINPILEGDVDIVPKGVLYSGPPGTGKTFFAKCLAGEANINFVEFKISKILDMWVGEAEKRFEKALACFMSIAPVGVFIDEIDQVFSRGENSGNEIAKNLFGMFLSVLSEPKNRGRILWVAATNYPNHLDDALKRTGRFDKKIPFLPPNHEERKQVFKIQLDGCNYPFKLNEVDYELIANKTNDYTQAEIEGVVVKALEVARRRKNPYIDSSTVLFAIENIVSVKNNKIKEMTDIAIMECNDMELMPIEYRELKRNLNTVNSKRRTARV